MATCDSICAIENNNLELYCLQNICFFVSTAKMFKTGQGHMSGPVLCYQKNSTFLEITLHLSIYLYSQMIKVRGSGQWLQISFRNPSDEITIKTTKSKNKNKISIKTQTVTPDLETSREIKETTSYRISSLLSPPNYSDEMMMMI